MIPVTTNAILYPERHGENSISLSIKIYIAGFILPIDFISAARHKDGVYFLDGDTQVFHKAEGEDAASVWKFIEGLLE